MDKKGTKIQVITSIAAPEQQPPTKPSLEERVNLAIDNIVCDTPQKDCSLKFLKCVYDKLTNGDAKLTNKHLELLDLIKEYIADIGGPHGY